MAGPLEGVKILELTAVVLGPWACQMLADMGAEVIKVEPPYGDSNRSLGASRNPKMSALYLTCNRNKRSLILDLKQPSARDAIMKIAEDVDVVIHNNRPQVMTKLGLEYKDFKAVNDNIIYCGTYGYGKQGPYGAKGALDDSIQSISGIAWLTQMVQGEPRYLPTIVCDKTTALYVVNAVSAALYHREKSGKGQEIEVPMFESMVYYNMAEHLWGNTFEPPIGKAGYTRLMSDHRKPYKTKDGYIAILPYLDAHWKKFCELAGREDLLEDPRFATLSDRVGNIDDTYDETAKTMVNRTTQEWLDLFGTTSVPTNAVNTLDSLLDDPHLNEVGFWQEIDHPTEGKLRMTKFPVNFSETPAENTRHQPVMGEHTRAILAEAGLSQDEIQAMLDSGATKAAD
ncbi:MAG: CoA transferase [Gammaproteobacteria bacterium]|nr:CoA transferase [Gammaproteobacteria bacterium]MCP4090112.1 CoA transferase [Gammaproteobacteria bacterium]MCP4276998.1 CoA transferase [Gammaproteobacteria bacterium]MCP4832779.1 CoA transferase [Gammaproteobacteria bacterium]MCP4929972.1 CoA transferase [Gammaproteobacteria bacterium]